MASTYSPSIIAITETWLNEEVSDGLLSIPSYSIYRSDRKERLGGGVCAFVRKSLNSIVLEICQHPPYFESLWLYLPESQIIFVVAYIPPKPSLCLSLDIELFITETADSFMNRGFGCHLIVSGDFNRLPLVKLCVNNNLKALVTSPTRGERTLDNILVCNQLASLYTCSVGPPLASSDHSVIFCSTSDYAFPPPTTSSTSISKVYDLRSSNINHFLATLNNVNWSEFYNMSYSVDEKCIIFHEVINLCVKQTVPVVVVKFSGDEKPWLTPVIKHLINLRWAAFRDRDFVKYNFFKAKVRKEIVKAKLRWGLNAKRSTKDLWRVTNSVVGRAKPSLSSFLSDFSTPVDAANAINTVFSNVFTRDGQILPADLTCSPNGVLHPIIPLHAVLRHLQNLKSGKSCGPDQLPNLIYKEAALLLVEPLTHLFNLCLSHGVFPAFWKRAHVVPVPKVRNPTVNDLRPISLLPSPSKIFEKILATYLSESFRVSAGLEQHGAIAGRSTSTALICIHDYVTQFLDRDDISGVQIIAYDISKAFDKISHNVIVSRLKESNFPPYFIQLIVSYLSNRSQCVKINGSLGDSLSATSGVPQGSVLGPMLFVAVMGTLKKRFPETGLVKFVDDVTLIVPTITGSSNNLVIEEDANFRSWAVKVGLVINERKSKCIVFPRSPTFVPTPLPHVVFVESLKILGVSWSSDLNWDVHFDAISRNFASRLHCLRVLKGFLAKEDLLVIYGALLRSLVEYCCPVFAAISKRNSVLLDRLQRRAHRIICGMDCSDSCLEDLSTRRLRQSISLFKHSQTTSHILNSLLPPRFALSGRFKLPVFKTTRRTKSFVPFMVLKELGFL